MNLNLVVFLSLFNWKMFSKISVNFGSNNRFYIPRILLILPLIAFFCYEAYIRGVTLRVLIIFVVCNILVEMTKISHRCFYDPIHFFFLSVGFKKKFIGIWLSEFFGVKFLLFAAFVCIAILVGNSTSISILLLVSTYFLIITTCVGLSMIGNRVKTVSIIYQWTLIMVFSFLISSLGIFTLGLDFHAFSDKIEEWAALHLGVMVWSGPFIMEIG